MKENLLLISLSCLIFSFFGCGGNNASDEVTQIQQYIQTTLKPKLQNIEDQIDLIETDSPISSDGTDLSGQRMSTIELQMSQALETIHSQSDKIFELEQQLADLRGSPPPTRTTLRSTAASTMTSPVSPVSAVSPSPAVSPVPVPTVETVGQPSIRDDYFDSKVVQHYRQRYTSSSSLSNYQITLKLGMFFEAQGSMDQWLQMDSTFEEKYRQAKILSGSN